MNETRLIVETYRRLRQWKKELTPAQTGVMEALDNAVRAGEVSAVQAAEIEAVIRAGHPHGARKRLTHARRISDTPSDPAAR